MKKISVIIGVIILVAWAWGCGSDQGSIDLGKLFAESLFSTNQDGFTVAIQDAGPEKDADRLVYADQIEQDYINFQDCVAKNFAPDVASVLSFDAAKSIKYIVMNGSWDCPFHTFFCVGEFFPTSDGQNVIFIDRDSFDFLGQEWGHFFRFDGPGGLGIDVEGGSACWAASGFHL